MLLLLLLLLLRNASVLQSEIGLSSSVVHMEQEIRWPKEDSLSADGLHSWMSVQSSYIAPHSTTHHYVWPVSFVTWIAVHLRCMCALLST